MSKYIQSQHINAIIDRNNYEGILDQDGWETLELTLVQHQLPLIRSMIITELKVRKLNLYEIYVFNDEPVKDGVYKGAKVDEISGWDTRWVLGTDSGIESFPHFDCVISKNDNTTGRRIGAIIWK